MELGGIGCAADRDTGQMIDCSAEAPGCEGVRARVSLLPCPMSVGEIQSEGIGRPAPFSEAGPRCLPLSVSVGADPSHQAPEVACDPRPEVGRYLRHRGTRFDLSDCAWPLFPPHGRPFESGRHGHLNPPAAPARPGSTWPYQYIVSC